MWGEGSGVKLRGGAFGKGGAFGEGVGLVSLENNLTFREGGGGSQKFYSKHFS